MSGTTDRAPVGEANELITERYRNRVTNRSYLVIQDAGGMCTLEGIDRRTVYINRMVLDSPASVWERLT